MDKSELWWNNNKRMAENCRQLFLQESQNVLQKAELILRNKFQFSDKWEMEQTSQPVAFPKQIDWETAPEGDPEWVYAMNRHACFLELGKAYILTGNEDYCSKFTELLLDWISRVPLTVASTKTAWRTLEAGLRCESWLKAYCCFHESLSVDTLSQFDSALRVHGEYLISVDDDFRILSNWGVLESHGLLLLGVYFKDSTYIKCALGRLARQLSVQILPDGVQWEQSPMYHCEVLHCYLDTVAIARRNRIALPHGFEETAHRMTNALAAWCKPDGHIPCQSDSDDIDARDLLAQGAMLFQDGMLKYAAGKDVFWENLWNLGSDSLKNYADVPAQKPEHYSHALKESGNYILRSSAGADSQYLRFRCGCLGSGHGHADLLHVDLYAYGEDILVDSGRYTYVDSAVRRELKQPSAHNTILIDGQNFSNPKNSWDYSKLAMPVKGECFFGSAAEFVSGAHLGYMDLPNGPAYVNRKVVWLKPDLYIICDEFYGSGEHTCEQYFHFNPDGTVSANPGTVKYTGKKAQAEFRFLHSELQTQVLPCSTSRKYNCLEQSVCVQNTLRTHGDSALITAVCTAGAEEEINFSAEEIPVSLSRTGEILSKEQAQAVRINRNGEKLIVLFCHQEVIAEVGFVEAGGCKGYGKTIVFTPDTPYGECLQW